MAEKLDINKLCSILDITAIGNANAKEIEDKFSKYKTLPQFGPLLLTIACNNENKFSNEISLNASIQLKNYINSYWRYGDDPEINQSLSFDNEQIVVISNEDKNYIRQNILEGIIYIVGKENIKILKQFNQCVKKILKLDYKSIWRNAFNDCIIKCFNSQDQKIIYSGIMLLYQLSKIYQYEDKLNEYNEILTKINDKIIFFMNECKNIKNNVEALVMYKFIKIFFKSFQISIPDILKTEEVYEKYSELIVHIIKTPLNQEYVEDKKNIFWKLKRICFQTLTRIVQKYANLNLAEKDKNEFQKLLEKKYIFIYLEVFTVIYKNYNSNQCYVDDFGKGCIYTYYCFLLGKKQFKDNILKLFMENDDLLEEIIKDCYMTKEDLEIWETDQKNYIAQKSQEISYYVTKRYKALKLVNALLDYKEKKTKKNICFNKIYEYLCNSMIKDAPNLEQEKNIIKSNFIKDPKYENYIINPNNIQHCLKKESIIFLIKNNAEIITKNADIEPLIQNYIFPELSSPCGLLREQSCHLITYFGNLPYKNNDLLESIIRKLCELMSNDPQLSVKLYASLAIGALFGKEITKKLLKGNIKNIFEIYLKLMEETDIEEIMDNLQEIVKYFTEESQQYITQLSEYLIKYFNKIISKDEDNEKLMDDYALISNIVTTFCNFIQYFINEPNIYSSIEKYIDILLEYCLNLANDKLEEGLDIIETILKYGNTIPNHVWKFFIPLVESITGTQEELTQFKEKYPGKIFTGDGYESIYDITKIISFFIAKEPNTFINMKDAKGNKYFDYAIKLIENIISKCESKTLYSDIKYSLKPINTLLDCYKGKVDNFYEQLIKFILVKYKTIKIKKDLEKYLNNLLSICFIYNPLKSLQIFQKEQCTKDIFSFWFKSLNKLERIEDMKYNLIGICSLISIEQNQQDRLIIENMNHIVESIYLITEKINKKKIESEIEMEKNNNENYDDLGDDEDNNNEEGNNKMDEMFKKILDGGNEDGEDEDLSYEEEDDDDQALTNFEKQSPILFVKNTFNDIFQKSPDIFKIIKDTLGDGKIQILNDIFTNEEKRLSNNK
jgi:hypothetical protein